MKFPKIKVISVFSNSVLLVFKCHITITMVESSMTNWMFRDWSLITGRGGGGLQNGRLGGK